MGSGYGDGGETVVGLDVAHPFGFAAVFLVEMESSVAS